MNNIICMHPICVQFISKQYSYIWYNHIAYKTVLLISVMKKISAWAKHPIANIIISRKFTNICTQPLLWLHVCHILWWCTGSIAMLWPVWEELLCIHSHVRHGRRWLGSVWFLVVVKIIGVMGWWRHHRLCYQLLWSR